VRFILLFIALAVLISAALAGFMWYSIEKPFGNIPPDGIFVDIPHGASQRAVARLLQRNGVIRSALAFDVYARRHPKRTLQAGEYFFDHSLSGKDAFWKLANGEVYQQPFTVKEGETIFDIARDLQEAKYMKADEFLKAARDARQILDIAPNAKTLEGFLFPATYNLPRNATATELTTMMVHKFREALQELAPDRANASANANVTIEPADLLHVVTLASLVERETPRPQERPLVSGVFTNRLQKGMLLQCDPTVIYALEQVGKYDGTLTLKDLRYDSAYNTYMFAGLPPGPIGNPSAESLKAAFHPAQTDYLYFVANTQGGHFFAATLAEHNQNVVKYHQLLKHPPPEQPLAEAGTSLPATSRQPATSANKGNR
jgi:UPF0755 protein